MSTIIVFYVQVAYLEDPMGQVVLTRTTGGRRDGGDELSRDVGLDLGLHFRCIATKVIVDFSAVLTRV